MNDGSLLAAAAQLFDEATNAESLSPTLMFQRCLDCGFVRYPAAPLCPECLSHDSEWREDSGKGTIWSWCIYHRAYNDAFAEAIPYNVALVELESGPRIISNILGSDKAPRIGDRVIATPREVVPGRYLIYFELIEGEGS